MVDKINIPEFFKDQEVFITGGSGFMGKALIEKILRSCPKVKKIYALIRTKKDKPIEARLQILKDNSVFDRLKEENPKQLDKLVAVCGDVSEIGLGISDIDLLLLQNVTIIFHAAASVRFDDPLTDAILMNTRGTRELLLFGEKLKKLKICVHVSTTYCNPKLHLVDEIIYPPTAEWQSTIKMAETLDENILNILTTKFMNFAPNTYTYTKGLAEQVVKDFQHRLPVVIYRPSIVISSVDEPVPGWLDNFNGPVGLLVACAIGIMRTTYGNPNTVSDYTPVDIAIKAMITVAWKHGRQKIPMDVYNCSTANVRHITMGQMIDIGRDLARDVPFDKMLWAPGGCITEYRALNYVRVIMFHILPAFFVDQIFRLTGKKQFLVKLQRRIYGANLALQYFILHQWEFKNEKFLALHNEVCIEDREDFTFETFKVRDVKMYLQSCILGARRYLLKEKDENIEKAKIHSNRLYLLDIILKKAFWFGCIYLLLFNYGWLIGL